MNRSRVDMIRGHIASGPAFEGGAHLLNLIDALLEEGPAPDVGEIPVTWRYEFDKRLAALEAYRTQNEAYGREVHGSLRDLEERARTEHLAEKANREDIKVLQDWYNTLERWKVDVTDQALALARGRKPVEDS